MNNNHGKDRRRRSAMPSVGTAISSAVVAYGAYRLGNWAWTAMRQDDNFGEEDETNQKQETSTMAGMLRGMLERPVGTGGEQQQQSRQHPQQRHRWKMRRQRIERCRDETQKALSDFLPTLRKVIDQHTDTATEIQALKQLRIAKKKKQQEKEQEQKQLTNMEDQQEQQQRIVREEQEKDLWNSIKIKSVTRMVATAYAHTVLFLVLTVQIHLLGGRLLDEHIHEQEQQQTEPQVSRMAASSYSQASSTVASERMGSYQSSHRLVLMRTYAHFFDKGISSLVQNVERAVQGALMDWNVMDPKLSISVADMQDKIQQIRDHVEDKRQIGSRHQQQSDSGATSSNNDRSRSTTRLQKRSILRFLVPPEQDLVLLDGLAQSILDETWDLMESPVLEDAQSACLLSTFQTMQEYHWSKIFADESSSSSSTAPTIYQKTGPHHQGRSVGKPLATVITQIKHISSSFFETTPCDHDDGLHLFSSSGQVEGNDYYSILEKIPAVVELGDVSFN